MRYMTLLLIVAVFGAWCDVIVENQNITVNTTGNALSCTVLAPTVKIVVTGPYTFNKASSADKGNLAISLDDCIPKPQIWKGDGKPLLAISFAPRQNLPQPLHVTLTVAPTRKVRDGTSLSVIKTQGANNTEVTKAVLKGGQAEFDLPGEPGLFGIFPK